MPRQEPAGGGAAPSARQTGEGERIRKRNNPPQGPDDWCDTPASVHYTSRSRTSLWRAVNAGQLHAPVKGARGHGNFWRRRWLDEWIVRGAPTAVLLLLLALAALGAVCSASALGVGAAHSLLEDCGGCALIGSLALTAELVARPDLGYLLGLGPGAVPLAFGLAAARVAADAVLATANGALTVLTVSFPRWIESLGVSPDGGSGAVEAAVVIVFAVVTFVFALRTRAAYRRLTRELEAATSSVVWL